jgi:hypothetical protein
MPPKPKPIALRIELCDVSPLIWRRIVVPNQWTLTSLHYYLQWVMGWQDSHAHEFRIGANIVAPDWWIQEVGSDTDTETYRDEGKLSVAAVATELGVSGEFEYAYDMGDGWLHRIVVESPPPAWANGDMPLPSCTAGENACPPDDVGGPPGYEHFLSVIANPKEDGYADMMRWVGGPFDRRGFDLNRINREWARARRKRR